MKTQRRRELLARVSEQLWSKNKWTQSIVQLMRPVSKEAVIASSIKVLLSIESHSRELFAVITGVANF